MFEEEGKYYLVGTSVEHPDKPVTSSHVRITLTLSLQLIEPTEDGIEVIPSHGFGESPPNIYSGILLGAFQSERQHPKASDQQKKCEVVRQYQEPCGSGGWL